MAHMSLKTVSKPAMRTLWYLVCVGSLMLAVMAGRAIAQDSAACIRCHDEKKVYQQSVHKSLGCADCHQGLREFTHPELGPNEQSPVSRGRIADDPGLAYLFRGYWIRRSIRLNPQSG